MLKSHLFLGSFLALGSFMDAQAASEKFSLTSRFSQDEGRFCTRDGWSRTDTAAMVDLRHKAKLKCTVQGDWKSYVELDIYCKHDCTESHGTVSVCTAWYKCSSEGDSFRD